MPVQVTAIGKNLVRVAAVSRGACSLVSVVSAAPAKPSLLQGPKANPGRAVQLIALPTRALGRLRAFVGVRCTRQASAITCSGFALRAAVLRQAVSSSGRPTRCAVATRCTAGRQDKRFACGARSRSLVRPSQSTKLGYSQPPLVWATNTPPPNLALQPKVNGLPPLGLHFILAQSRQSIAFG